MYVLPQVIFPVVIFLRSGFMTTKQSTLRKLTVSAVLIALSTVLSLVKVFEMPLGGSITLFSMLPVCLIGILYGTKYAVLPCVLYGAIQMFIGNPFGWGLTPTVLIGSIFLDYLFAFGVLCTSGIMRDKGKYGLVCGVAIASVLRFISHFIAGFILWTNFEQFNLFGQAFVGKPILYSACYNGFYMLPELIITVIGAWGLEKSGAVRYIRNLTER